MDALRLAASGSNGLSFGQSLTLTLIGAGISVGVTAGLFYVMFKTDLFVDFMKKMVSLIDKMPPREYQCQCDRCKAQLRTKAGRKQWKRDHRWKKEELV